MMSYGASVVKRNNDDDDDDMMPKKNANFICLI